MLSFNLAPSYSLSCAAGDGSLFLHRYHPQQQQLCHRLGLDQAAASSSFPSEGVLVHRLVVASSLSSLSNLARDADGVLLLGRATHLLSLSRADYGDIHHHRHQRQQQQQHGIHIQASKSPSSSSVGACAGSGNLWQKGQNHLFLTLPLAFPCIVCAGNGGGLLEQQQFFPPLHAHSKQHLSLQEQQERLLQQQQKREVIKKQESIILESIAEHQRSLKNSALASIDSQTEPNAIGYLPPEIDINSCRSVYVGNIHRKVTAEFLGEVFSTVGTLAGCKLIKKLKSSYAIVEYLDHRAAAVAIATLNGRQLFNLPIKVNWAYSKEQREDKTGHHTIFVGDLSADVTEAALFAFFSTYPSCSDVRVIWDPRSGQSKGFGFVSFREREDAEKAIEEMTGKMLGRKEIRCDWATLNDSGNEGQEVIVKRGPENDPRYTTVFVGNLACEITEDELRKQFDMLGIGVIKNVLIPEGKSFGFVRYSTHEEAALAIGAANKKVIGGKPVVCSWGRKRTLDATAESHPLAPPVPALEQVKAEG